MEREARALALARTRCRAAVRVPSPHHLRDREATSRRAGPQAAAERRCFAAGQGDAVLRGAADPNEARRGSLRAAVEQVERAFARVAAGKMPSAARAAARRATDDCLALRRARARRARARSGWAATLRALLASKANLRS